MTRDAVLTGVSGSSAAGIGRSRALPSGAWHSPDLFAQENSELPLLSQRINEISEVRGGGSASLHAGSALHPYCLDGFCHD